MGFARFGCERYRFHTFWIVMPIRLRYEPWAWIHRYIGSRGGGGGCFGAWMITIISALRPSFESKKTPLPPDGHSHISITLYELGNLAPEICFNSIYQKQNWEQSRLRWDIMGKKDLKGNVLWAGKMLLDLDFSKILYSAKSSPLCDGIRTTNSTKAAIYWLTYFNQTTW